MNKRFTYSGLLVLGIVVSMLFVLQSQPLLYNTPLQRILPFQPVRFLSKDSSISVSLRSPRDVTQTLIQAGVINQKTITHVDIVLTDRENPNAAFVREDIPGQILLTSNYTVTGTTATITLYLSPSAKNFPYEQQRDLLNYYFWETANLIRRMNNVSETETPPVFL